MSLTYKILYLPTLYLLSDLIIFPFTVNNANAIILSSLSIKKYPVVSVLPECHEYYTKTEAE